MGWKRGDALCILLHTQTPWHEEKSAKISHKLDRITKTPNVEWNGLFLKTEWPKKEE